MNLDEIIERLQGDQAQHTTAGPSTEEELRQTESALGYPLPAPLRSLLLRLGGGIYYGLHEIFGSHRVMIHDIELVPPLRQAALVLGREAGLPADQLPFHRAHGRLHTLAVRAPHTVRAWPAAAQYASLEEFLERVVLAGRSESS